MLLSPGSDCLGSLNSSGVQACLLSEVHRPAKLFDTLRPPDLNAAMDVKSRFFLLLQGLVLALSFEVAAQGTLYFTTRVMVQGVDARVYDMWTGTAVERGQCLAALYWGTSASSLEPVYTLVDGVPTYAARDFAVATGYVNAGKIAILGAVEGASVYVQMRVWSVDGGGTYEEAFWSQKYGVRTGSSNIIRVTLGGDNLIPPAPPAYLTGLQGFWVTFPIPESTPAVLGLLGSAALLLRPRRVDGW
jgi:hypothetical protein